MKYLKQLEFDLCGADPDSRRGGLCGPCCNYFGTFAGSLVDTIIQITAIVIDNMADPVLVSWQKYLTLRASL